jgi:hypothetical protein
MRYSFFLFLHSLLFITISYKLKVLYDDIINTIKIIQRGAVGCPTLSSLEETRDGAFTSSAAFGAAGMQKSKTKGSAFNYLRLI